MITYKYYDEKKRRLAILVKELDLSHTEITIITCSRKDAFHRKQARKALETLEHMPSASVYINGNLVHPVTTIIAHAGTPNTIAFANWANSSYYKVGYKLQTYAVKQLERRNDRIYISKQIHGKW